MKSKKSREDYLTDIITESILKAVEEQGLDLGGQQPGGMGGGMGAPGGMGAGAMGGGMGDEDDSYPDEDMRDKQDTGEDEDGEAAMNEFTEIFRQLPKNFQEQLIQALTDIMNEDMDEDEDEDEDEGDEDEEYQMSGGMGEEESDDNEDAPTPPTTTKSISSLNNRGEYVLKSLASDYLSIRGATYDRDQERAKVVEAATRHLNISPAAFRAYANKMYKRR